MVLTALVVLTQEAEEMEEETTTTTEVETPTEEEETLDEEATARELMERLMEDPKIKLLLTTATIAFACVAIYYFLKW